MGFFNKNVFKSEEERLYDAIQSNKIKRVRSIIDKANKKKILLNVHYKNDNGFYALILAIRSGTEMVKLIIEYANIHNFILKLNDTDYNGRSSFFWAVDTNKIEIVKLLIEYANNHNTIFDLNEKNRLKEYPLLLTTHYNNVEIIKLLIEYANDHNIILELNDRDDEGDNPLYWAILWNNYEMVKIIIEYAKIHDIKLEYDEKDIGENPEIIELLHNIEK